MSLEWIQACIRLNKKSCSKAAEWIMIIMLFLSCIPNLGLAEQDPITKEDATPSSTVAVSDIFSEIPAISQSKSTANLVRKAKTAPQVIVSVKSIIYLCVYDNGSVEYRDTPCAQAKTNKTIEFEKDLSYHIKKATKLERQEIHRFLQRRFQEERLQVRQKQANNYDQKRTLQTLKLKQEIELLEHQLHMGVSAKQASIFRLKLRHKRVELSSLNRNK